MIGSQDVGKKYLYWLFNSCTRAKQEKKYKTRKSSSLYFNTDGNH